MSLPRAAAPLLTALAWAALALPAAAVLVVSGDGQGNTAPPGRDWPWHHVGTRGDFSAVYLGHRWVLTAAHVGAASVEFEGREYAAIESSITTIVGRNGTPSDLIAFRIGRPVGRRGPSGPPLPLLPIARSRPPPGSPLILIGNGFDRGEELRWTAESGRVFQGWHAAATRHLRWGTNRLDREPVDLTFRGIRTVVLAMTFSPPSAPDATPHEAQAVVGDSGGAVFVRDRGRFELAGIMIVRSQHPGQPEAASLFGNRTFAADLSAYRDQLIALTRPDCADERDNDDDGAIDYPTDGGCERPADDSEHELPRQ